MFDHVEVIEMDEADDFMLYQKVIVIFSLTGSSSIMSDVSLAEVLRILQFYFQANFTNKTLRRIHGGRVSIYLYYKICTGVNNMVIRTLLLNKFNSTYLLKRYGLKLYKLFFGWLGCGR